MISILQIYPFCLWGLFVFNPLLLIELVLVLAIFCCCCFCHFDTTSFCRFKFQISFYHMGISQIVRLQFMSKVWRIWAPPRLPLLSFNKRQQHAGLVLVKHKQCHVFLRSCFVISRSEAALYGSSKSWRQPVLLFRCGSISLA